MRADQLLVHRGLAASRSQAQRLIDSGVRTLTREGWRAVNKSDELFDDAELELLNAAEAKYVSRGGLKLEGALAQSGISANAKLCFDIGQSTGGFTDCLLQAGAALVVGVDVGHAQLHPKLRADERVICLEKINARELNTPDLIAACADSVPANGQFDLKKRRFQLLVGDVSFISQTLLVSRFSDLLAKNADVLMLVKPQFELQPGDLAKGGIVKDASLYRQVEQRIRESYAQHSLTVKNYFESPIAGGDGNREFFVHAVKE
ncbi:TlyA family RNA methyltransferase [Variovorax sp. PCZ-1]|uniref:TlyA family RNA methyltransferase n=1 Tax=Variovorax sp. PCZ-1 TaxID=2835533 RepID=UPI001BCE6333|nr:TlyA family RNA methyltransferase [Variovorax sp. PCZ-1]MBS7806512.1 TlyA family RNA methyltransferase [Variovorax sp. PCZ-1]